MKHFFKISLLLLLMAKGLLAICWSWHCQPCQTPFIHSSLTMQQLAHIPMPFRTGDNTGHWNRVSLDHLSLLPPLSCQIALKVITVHFARQTILHILFMALDPFSYFLQLNIFIFILLKSIPFTSQRFVFLFIYR